jgi:DNA-binding transcriptional LysR family regulator
MKFQAASLVELHAFLGVCRTGSMRRAAEQLCVTQAAVSRAVARLEERLGQPLFDRNAQGVLPTARALDLRQRIEPSVDALERAFAEIRRASRARRRTLRLSVVPTLGTRWLMPRLSRFQAQHPDIDIELRQSRRDEDFRRDDVDIWIEIKRPDRPWPRDISARYLLGRDITPVCSPAMARRLKSPRDLMQEPLLYHTNYPANWSLWFGAANVRSEPLELGGGFDLAGNLIAAACAGMGVAVVQPCLVERELGTGELVRPFALEASTGRGYYVCVRKAVADDDLPKRFVGWVKTLAKSHDG